MNPKGSLFLAAALLLSGCALTYEKDQIPQPDSIPQMVFDTLRQTGVKNGHTLYTMETDGAQVFQTKKEMLLKRFRFREYDSQGVLASQGEADSATIDTATNDARLAGRLKARSEDQKVTLEVDGGPSGGLRWTNEDRVLRTEPNTPVRLTKDDGSKIEAQGLVLDLWSNTLDLEESVRGTWTPESKKDADKPVPPRTPASASPP